MKRILIVDDALDLGRLLQTVFLTLDPSLSINVVPSAEEALLESTRKNLDLLVSDIRLPGMSGFDLVKKIRARHPTIKVLFITGLTDPSLGGRAAELNADGFFHKPLDMTRFLSAARKCLELPAESPLSPVRPETVQVVPPSSTAAGVSSPKMLSDLVAGLRQRLGALAVFVLDVRGRIVVQAGDIPALPLEEQWAGPVMTALSASQKVARLAGDGNSPQVLAYSGKESHLLVAPAGEYALLVMLRPGRSALRLSLAVEETLEAQLAVAEALAGILRPAEPAAQQPVGSEVTLPPTTPLPAAEHPGPAVPVVEEPSLVDFENLLKQSADQLKDKDVDAFWDTAALRGQPGATTDPDALSYDQARKLGLAPKDSK